MESTRVTQKANTKKPTHIMLPESSIQTYLQREHTLPSLTLTQRQLCDVEMILNGGFAPLTGFLERRDYESVLNTMRLADGTLWPMPIQFDVTRDVADKTTIGDEIALRDTEGLLIAILQVNDIWAVNREQEAEAVFGTTDTTHPAVAYLYQEVKDFYLGGTLLGISLPCHYDFTHLRFTPEKCKALFREKGWERIVAFQTRNPMHRAHQELTLRAAEQVNANILVHPVVGMTKPGDIEYYTRVRCYEHAMQYYPHGLAMLSLLPLAMRMGGPREALWHAIIRKNYGCTHFIVGRDHAGPGKNREGNNFYDPYAAQTLTLQHEKELGIGIVPFQEMVYSQKQAKYFTVDAFPANETPSSISGTELRERLQKNLDIPEWFSHPAVINELRRVHPPKHKQGFTLFFTGLPSSGKSTLANALFLKLRELTHRPVTLLDGDVVRTHLTKGLGFSQEDREQNITRVGFVAKEITKHGGIVICALVSPFAKARQIVRQMISQEGGFIEVYVSTSLEVCEKRDRKGMYQKARQGLIQQFTGVSDVYEVPEAPEILIDTANKHPETLINELVEKIKLLGYVQ